MIQLLFDIYIIIVSVVLFRNIWVGFLLTLISKIIIPSVVRFSLGPLSIAINDVFTLVLLASFILHRQAFKSKVPGKINKYFCIYSAVTFVLIFLSSAYVPYDYQLFSFFKGFLFQTILYIWIGYNVLQEINISKYFNVICVVSLLAGLYGIYSYAIGENPYISALNLIYGWESEVSYFMEEIRGGLQGRTYGTMDHPLSWGQFWNIFICLVWFFRGVIRKYLFIALLTVAIVNIVLCGSRSALIALLLFFIFVLLSYGTKKLLWAIPLAYISVSAFLMIIPQEMKNSGLVSYIESGVFFWDSSYSEKAGIAGSSKEMRVVQLQKSVDIMSRNPIGGVGYNYQYYVLKTDRAIDSELYGLESIVFKILVEQGLTGLIVFFYTFNMLRIFSIKKKDMRTRVLINGYFLSFLGSILITGLQGSSYTFFMLFLLFILNKTSYDSQNNSLLLVKQRSYS